MIIIKHMNARERRERRERRDRGKRGEVKLMPNTTLITDEIERGRGGEKREKRGRREERRERENKPWCVYFEWRERRMRDDRGRRRRG